MPKNMNAKRTQARGEAASGVAYKRRVIISLVALLLCGVVGLTAIAAADQAMNENDRQYDALQSAETLSTKASSKQQSPSMPIKNQTPIPTKIDQGQTYEYQYPTCEYIDIPYETLKFSDSNLLEGKTRTEGGSVGVKEVCTYHSGIISGVTDTAILSWPVDKIIYTGTYTFEKALSDANYACRHTNADSTDRTSCVNTQMREYGY